MRLYTGSTGRGIPVNILEGNCGYQVNAGKAKSEGVELEIQGYILENLLADFSASYGEATLEETSSIGNKGDNLPGSADFNLSIGLQYDFSLAGHDSFARIDYAYIGEYYATVAEDEFGDVPAGDYGQINLKVGMSFDQVALDLFVNNLSNDDGLSWVENTNSGLGGGRRAYRLRPRTMGLNLSYLF